MLEVEMKMPDLATTESAVKVTRWLVGEGQAVKRGQPVLEVETDKATMEVESTVQGVLRSITAKAGQTVAVGEVIAVFTVESQGTSSGMPSGTASGAIPIAQSAVS